MEGITAAEGREVTGRGRVTTDQGGDGGMRDPGGAVRMMDPGGAEVGNSQGEADWSTDQGGVMGSAAHGVDRGSKYMEGLRLIRAAEWS